jgi:N-methylhydantoinase B
MTIWDGVQRGYIPGETLRIPGTLKLHTATADVDPVTFEVIRYSLMNTNIEHGRTIQRLAVSPVTMVTRDFQPSILNESGDLVFLGPYLQYLSNAQALTTKWILENRAGNPGIEPGDMFVSNDPYVGSPHQPDTVVTAPVFVGDELFCWVANVMHHADVGGSVMGSFCVDATDIFTDPPPFPPFKLVSRGQVQRDLEEVFLRQSRVPVNVHMDLRAAISANRVAAQRITGLADRYGADAVKAVMNRVLDAGERTVAQRLSMIPDGRWSHRLYAEAAHTGDTGIYAYQITVRKQGEHLYVDNAGTDPQTGSINVTYAGFSGAFLSALTGSLTADLAGAYGGVYRRVHIEPVPGTLACADFPAAVSPAGIYTMETLISLSGAVIGKMLACAEPEVARLAIGPAHPVFYGFISGGAHPTGSRSSRPTPTT